MSVPLNRDDAVQMASLAAQILEPEPEELFTLQLMCLLFYHSAEDDLDREHILSAIVHLHKFTN